MKKCWKANDDGGGFAFARDGKIKITKCLVSFKDFWSRYRKAVKENPDKHFLIHCRIKTSGKVNLENCHPFVVRKGLVMIHNGIIDIEMPNKERSDTFHFAQLLGSLKDSPMESTAFASIIENAIGTSNKIAFLDARGRYLILNEKGGDWKDGIWFSNQMWNVERHDTEWWYDHDPYIWGNSHYSQPYGCRLCGAYCDDKESNLYCKECLTRRKEYDETQEELIKRNLPDVEVKNYSYPLKKRS